MQRPRGCFEKYEYLPLPLQWCLEFHPQWRVVPKGTVLSLPHEIAWDVGSPLVGFLLATGREKLAAKERAELAPGDTSLNYGATN